MAKKIECDVAIIGAGSAGLTAYRAVLKAGQKPLLIEGGPHGTMCARVGCMPSKLLIAAAEAAHAVNNAAGFGIKVNGTVKIDGRAVMQRLRSERDRFVSFVVADVKAMPAANRLDQYVRFKADGILEAADGTEIHAHKVIIATGTTPIIPDEYKVLDDLAITNDDVFSWQDLPASILVVGSGVIGVELGLALKHLGVRVRVLNRSNSFAHIQDPEVHKLALDIFTPELNLASGAKVLDIKRVADKAQVSWQDNAGNKTTETFDFVLLSAGRKPVLDSLNLAATSARLDSKGMPEFDPDTLQLTGIPVFIAGDVSKSHAIQHEASDDGYVSGTNASLWPQVKNLPRRAPMAVVFSNPQIMQVGGGWRSFDAATMAVGAVDWQRQGRSRVMLKNQGLLRVYMHKDTKKFIGAEMLGPDAEHVAHLLAWCLQMGLTVPQMLALPFYHPTIEEGIRTALRDVIKS